MNEYFVPGAVPAPNSPGSSAVIRAEFTSIAAAFDKLPVLAGGAGEFVIVNETGTAMIASGFLFSDFVTLSGVQTLTNKTLAWAGNTWPGFGTGATKVAGTGADNVLLLAEDSKLPVLDGSLLTNLNPGELGVVPIANGGTGASTLGGAQTALGIDLKADANNAVLAGAPTCPTPPVGNSSARIANTQFVTDTVTAIGAAIPSDATPLMDGVATPGVHAFVSRDDHVHPVDTSRAPASAATATGTSFAPVGGVAATNVQAAISELDTEKAPLASPALTGTPTSTTPLTSDNSTRIATTAFMQSLLAQQPPGVEVSDSTPLMNGVAAPGTGVEASRYDHVHPTDTSRAALAATVTKTSATGSAVLPVGTTAQRDASPLKGYFRYNDDLDIFEGYTEGIGWGQVGGGQLAGFRNILINGDMRINQRGVTIAGAANGSYGPDRWKKVDASNMTQIIESGNFVPSATYTLSGIGVTTQQLTSPASGDWTLPNIPLAATKVQLELGSIATPFEFRPIGLELSLCQRYYWKGLPCTSLNFPSYSNASVMAFAVRLPQTMRAAPSLGMQAPGVSYNVCAITGVDSATQNGFRIVATSTSINANANIAWNTSTDYFTANAEL